MDIHVFTFHLIWSFFIDCVIVVKVLVNVIYMLHGKIVVHSSKYP